ncbi:MAG: AAA family ATPase [Opitutales bacterium]
MPVETSLGALRQPGFWPQPGPVEVIETHISRVFLVGDRAYKLKKPVDFGFVDFTTLEKRRHSCEEELRLNRRLAPDLYLAIRTLTGAPDRPDFEGEGEPIDYAVEMKRFDQGDLMANVERAGKLTCEHMEQLARIVAGFHEQCGIAGPEASFGNPQEVARPVDENFRILLADNPSTGQKERLRFLRAWSQDEWSALFRFFNARKSGGRIRECHGDMHLSNMILKEERITLFDCLEFSPELRWIDVLSEVAFCTMDLASRRRDSLAHYFLNAYLEITGDYPGLAVLPYYLSYRAMVRAKVSWLRLQEAPEEGEEQLRENLAKCLSLAETYAFRRQPQLIVMHGVSGTGKSYGGSEIMKNLGAIRIRSDVERKRIAADIHESDLYSPEMTRLTYNSLHKAAESGLQAGFPVVLDAAYLHKRERARARQLAERLKVPFRLLHLSATEETMEKRIRQRQKQETDPSDADWDVLQKQLASREPLTKGERERALDVDTDRPGCWEETITLLQFPPHHTRRIP